MNLISKNSIFFFLILIAALIVRVLPLIVGGIVIDSDEAIVGLMAKHILERGELPIFYYGQHYMGSLEAIIAAGFFLIFGINNFALKAVPLLFSLFNLPLVYLITKEIAGLKAARWALVLAAFPPLGLVEWSTMARGGFMEIVFIGTLAIHLTILWLKEKQLPKQLTKTLLVGLVLGIGWWVNNQIVFSVAPIALVFLVSLISRGQLSILFCHLILGIISFIAGSLPFWIYNLENSFASFGLFTLTDNLAKNIGGFLDSALPILLGARRFWHNEDIFFEARYLAYAFYSVVLLFYLIYLYRNSLDLKRFLTILLPSLTIFFSLLIFVLSSFGALVTAPRYLLPLYPHLFVIAAVALINIKLMALRITLFLGILTINFLSCYLGGIHFPSMPFADLGDRVSRDHSELYSFLKEEKINIIRTNYWIGYRAAFETLEKIKPVQFGEPKQVRIANYEKNIGSYDLLPLVLTSKQGESIATALVLAGYMFNIAFKSNYFIIYNIRTLERFANLKPIKITNLQSNLNKTDPQLTIDNNINTRWASGEPQNPSMYLQVRFAKPKLVKAVVIKSGQWRTDFARKLEILCQNEINNEIILLNGEDYLDLMNYYQDKSLKVFVPEYVCRSLTFRQIGSDSYFDWSIAELKIYGER
jgi:4-amino-4-deoxy-L-arabinose transferase-like glycosyltransferase